MLKTPPHILVTTPESLYLLLTAERSRDMLRSVRTVIVDEIHAVIGTRPRFASGADARTAGAVRRSALSATAPGPSRASTSTYRSVGDAESRSKTSRDSWSATTTRAASVS
jgi:hypothetical protein